MRIREREVGPGHPVVIIAEIGSNHDGNLRLALNHIDMAAWAGADAVKFQMFRADRLYDRRSPHHGSVLKYEVPHEWLPILADHAASRKLTFLCTAFDTESLEVVDPYVPAHKIGSLEASWPPYVAAVVMRRKPILISTGAGALVWPLRAKPADVIPLHCVSAYPADLADMNLAAHPAGPWGLSDHTVDPLTAPCSAVAMGACVIEKHMREDYSPGASWRGTPDELHSIPVSDFKRMVQAIRRTETVIGSPIPGVREGERPMMALHRGPRGLRGA